MEIKNHDIVHWLEKMSKKAKIYLSKYCHFFQEYKHDTEDYFILKKGIEALVY